MTEEYVKVAVEMIESGPLKRTTVFWLFSCRTAMIASPVSSQEESGERYYRPTFVLTRGEEGVKGSARSDRRLSYL